jgi:selenocysteine lyase/cysteine desulfurase
MSPTSPNIQEWFPSPQSDTYYNTAGAALTPRDVQREVADFLERLCGDMMSAIPDAISRMARLRAHLAGLMNAEAREVAILHHTAEAANVLAHGLRWNPGDIVLSLDREYPSTIYPWMNLEKYYGVRLELLKEEEGRLDESRIAEEIRRIRPRLFAISAVEWTSGYHFDLEPLGRVCEEVGAFFFVDAAQALGFWDIDVKRARISGLAGSAWKWLFGPAGQGYLYLREDLLDSVSPVFVGADSVRNHGKTYFPYDFNFRDGMERFEYSTFSFSNMVWFDAGVRFVLERGLENVRRHSFALADLAMDALAEFGCLFRGNYPPERRSGIMAFRIPGVDSLLLSKRLGSRGIVAKERDGCVRLSFHLYNTPRGIATLRDALGEILKGKA